MYSSCLVCRSSLGTKSALPQLPPGEHIAFAPDDGRLWVICDRCGEWNLAPVRRRQEAIEAAERLYESATERAASEKVAVAEGTGVFLVRVGKLTELPTLRYGDRLATRSRRAVRAAWRRRIKYTGITLGSAALGAMALGSFGFAVGMMAGIIGAGIVADQGLRPVAELTPRRGDRIRVTSRDLRDARLVPRDDWPGWSFRVRKGVELEGRDAVEAVRLLCPLLNASPEPHDLLRKAIAYIEAKDGTLDSVFSAAARRRGRRRTARLSKLDPHIRMALEILASADSENRALSGDLKTLEMAWERADELAEIEDDLAFELGVVERLRAGEPS